MRTSSAPEPPCHAGAVERHVAAAEHDHLLAHRHLVAEVDGAQELGAHQGALAVGAGQAELLALVRADGDQHRVVPLIERASSDSTLRRS